MKPYLFFITFIIAFTINVKAQKIVSYRHKLDENSVVKDSSGTVYIYAVWQKLLSTGEYSLRAANPQSDTTSFLIYKMNEKQKALMMDHMPKPKESEDFPSGTKFTGFKEKDINGEKLDFKNLTGKVIVLNFWFIGCPPCRQEIPELNKLVEDYKNKDVVFVAVALDEKYDIKEFLKTTPYNYHIIDNGRYLANSYKVHLFPTNVVIDQQGIIKYSSVGFGLSTPVWIRKTLDSLLK